jgi:oxygen-independent coproporphyrinogen-3 oxidase
MRRELRLSRSSYYPYGLRPFFVIVLDILVTKRGRCLNMSNASSSHDIGQIPISPVSLSLDLLESIALYIHIPFCHAKCHYCDFNSYAGLLGWRRKYVQALIREIKFVGDAARVDGRKPRRCRTIFFGGGTPSLLQPDEVADILAAVHGVFNVDSNAEITLEANPGTVERGHLAELHATGLTRLSMGAQSFDADLLKWLGRIHSPAEIISAVHAARIAGFTSLNLDFIFALPQQTMSQWQDTLEQALSLEPEHFSFYSLIVEPETPLFDWVQAGNVIPADEDQAADMYTYAVERMSHAGYEQYEISNWSRSGYQCRHNLTYWHNLPYLGVGAGAHSSYNNRRFSNVRPVQGYIDSVQRDWHPDDVSLGMVGGPIATSDEISRLQSMSETCILALRLNEGLDLDFFFNRFGQSMEEVFGSRLTDLFKGGLIEYTDNNDNTNRRLCLTTNGRLLGNEVFERFLIDE